jgi:ABC-type nitrate/sulfonate/bicarbonate transport system permease component
MRGNNRINTLINTFLSITILIILWYIIAIPTPRYLFPYPHQVVIALIDLLFEKNLLINIFYSFVRVSLGFILGVFIGIGIGVLALLSRLFREIIYPLISFIIVTPSFAFIPLLMIWIGLNDLLVITTIIICTSFPIMYALISSYKYISRELIEAAIIDGASNIYIVLYIILPLSITHLATILRYESGHSWRLGFVSEYIALSNGLGVLMLYAYSTLRVDEVIALIIIIGLLTLLFQKEKIIIK